MALSDGDEVLQFVKRLSLDTVFPVSHKAFPILVLRCSLTSKKKHEERLVKTIGTIFMLQLIEQGMPHLLIHTLKVGPRQHIFCTMKGSPGTLPLKTDVMHTLYHKLTHAVVEHLCLDFAVHHLAHELLYLLTCGNRYLQGEETNEVIFQWVFPRTPGHHLCWQFRHYHPSCLTEIVQHLQVILGLDKVLIRLVVHVLFYPFAIRYSAKILAALSTLAAQGRDL